MANAPASNGFAPSHPTHHFSVETPNASGTLLTLTLPPVAAESPADACRRLAPLLREKNARPVHMQVFGSVDASRSALAALEAAFGGVDWPVTWVEGSCCQGKPIAGMQIHAFTGPVERVTVGNRVVASVFTTEGFRQCFVGGLVPGDITASRSEQTRRTLEELQQILARAGFDLGDTVRTWFYLEDILSWYNDFNRARTGIYSQVQFRTGSLPASTGVGAKNPAGAALALSALALRPLAGGANAVEVASPLQCPAPAYGSSFSRAMEITSANRRRLHVSGTASIAPGGKTLWVGDIEKQVELSMKVVAAILQSRGFSFSDTTRATAYFRHAADVRVFTEWLEKNLTVPLPLVLAQCDVCRDDLLFEFESEAEQISPMADNPQSGLTQTCGW